MIIRAHTNHRSRFGGRSGDFFKLQGMHTPSPFGLQAIDSLTSERLSDLKTLRVQQRFVYCFCRKDLKIERAKIFEVLERPSNSKRIKQICLPIGTVSAGSNQLSATADSDRQSTIPATWHQRQSSRIETLES